MKIENQIDSFVLIKIPSWLVETRRIQTAPISTNQYQSIVELLIVYFSLVTKEWLNIDYMCDEQNWLDQ